MNPLLVTYPANAPAGAETHIVHALPATLVNDTECTAEAIDERANHVGPVLKDILADMEKHWLENSDLDLES